MEPLLALAEELERREERALAEQAEVEELGRDVERVRAAAADAAAFLAALPGALEAAAEEEHAAEQARAAADAAARDAENALAHAEDKGREDERLAAARAAQHARDRLHEAELRVEAARAERARLAQEGERREAEAAALAGDAQALAARLAALPRVAREAVAEPGAGLDGVLEWAAQARGGLLVAAAGIAAERDRVAREATELVAAVSGDPLSLAGVSGIRERLERALSGG